FLSLRFRRDRKNRKLWISQETFIDELLESCGMTDVRGHDVPLQMQPADAPPRPEALPSIPDNRVLPEFQRLVGSFIWLACSTRPDLAYTAMALGQFNASATRGQLLLAKGVLRYLHKTRLQALEYD
ncbi:hypothetical protein EV121DRAFT_179702, partial [Schizophyllum commune]